MKIYRIFIRRFFLLLIAFLTLQISYAQSSQDDNQKKAEMQNIVQSKDYVFLAQSVLPLSGRSINLTTVYDLKIKADTIISALPYFGRAYVAPLNSAEGGIRFTSTDNAYTIKDRKKGGWDISIVPKDGKDVRQMLLTVFENGQASLQVISNNRQSISYNGYITGRNTGNKGT